MPCTLTVTQMFLIYMTIYVLYIVLEEEKNTFFVWYLALFCSFCKFQIMLIFLTTDKFYSSLRPGDVTVLNFYGSMTVGVNKALLSPHRRLLKGFPVKVTDSGIWHTFKLTETDRHAYTHNEEHHGITGVTYSIKYIHH